MQRHVNYHKPAPLPVPYLLWQYLQFVQSCIAEEINNSSELLFPLFTELLFGVRIDSQLTILSELFLSACTKSDRSDSGLQWHIQVTQLVERMSNEFFSVKNWSFWKLTWFGIMASLLSPYLFQHIESLCP